MVGDNWSRDAGEPVSLALPDSLGADDMRRLIPIVLVVLAGCCQSFVGPLQRAGRPLPPPDDPRLNVAEQEKRGRAQLAYPEESPLVTPIK
jgi:hypothetical protein